MSQTKEYNEWYWKLYRWFRWDAKHAHRDIAQGFRNLWKWFPIIWKDRDWDDHFIFEVLKFKIKNTADYTEKKQRFVGWENEVRYMRICEKLMGRIQNEYYQTEYQDYYDFDMSTVPAEDGLYEVVFDVKRDDTAEFVKKYPHALRRAKKDPRYENFFKDKKTGGLAVGMIRHEKARKLLFKILEQRIERWWD
jgi:hypothetical protein